MVIGSIVSAVIFMAAVVITFVDMWRKKGKPSLYVYIGCWGVLSVGLGTLDLAPVVTFFICSGEATLLAYLGHYFSWTKDKNSDIIKEKEEGKQCQSEIQSGVPAGYDDWTDNEKTLYAIESRLTEGKTQEEKGEAESREEAIDNIVPKVCLNCGCIVGNDACFCSQCGERLSVPDSVETQKGNSARVPMANETDSHPRHVYRPNTEIGSLINEVSTLNREDELF